MGAGSILNMRGRTLKKFSKREKVRLVVQEGKSAGGEMNDAVMVPVSM